MRKSRKSAKFFLQKIHTLYTEFVYNKDIAALPRFRMI